VQRTRSDINMIIDRNLARFNKPGVLSVRPGLRMKKGWLTDEPAIVVTVHQKLASPPRGTALPKRVGGMGVDVREASAAKREEILNPTLYSTKLRLTPDTGAVPHFADERTPSGTRPTLAASAHAQLAASAKPHIGYTPASGVRLEPVEEEVTIRASASPDSGWSMLKSFLTSTGKSLTVGLYDFTAHHIEEAVAQTMSGKKLRLVLDHPAVNPTADETDAQTVAELGQQLGSGFEQAWALTRTDPQATSWIYPSAYHIKVAVQDSSAFWLSSGNWNNSNQPDIQPAIGKESGEEARGRDRDWHVVIESKKLAGVFESYILNDLSVAAANNSGTPAVPSPVEAPGAPKRARAFKRFFAAKEFKEVVRMTPLLTPDPGVYTTAVKQLIESAGTTLYMQFQYIELPREANEASQPFLDLVDAVIARQQARVDVRIILSEFEKPGYLEQLHERGLDVVNIVKIQNNVHNKGIVVDGQKVLVSSQNWSTDGTLYNRDAGVILESAKIAGYFQEIFEHDWENLAEQKSGED
jgi:PLD-like domain